MSGRAGMATYPTHGPTGATGAAGPAGTSAPDGVAVGSVLVSDGIGAPPVWSATPTVAALTLASPASTSTGYTALTLPSSDATKGPFALVYNQSGVFEGARDPILFFGYNVGPAGAARINAADNQGAMYLAIEGNWRTGGVDMTEFHIESIDALAVVHRLLSLNTVNSSGASTGAVKVHQLVVYDKNNNTPLLSINNGAVGNAAAAQCVLNNGDFYFGKYGAEIKALNAAGAAYHPLIGFDPNNTLGTDRIVVGWPVANATQSDVYLAGKLALINQTAGEVPLKVQAKTGQSVVLTEWLGADGVTVLASVTEAGGGIFAARVAAPDVLLSGNVVIASFNGTANPRTVAAGWANNSDGAFMAADFLFPSAVPTVPDLRLTRAAAAILGLTNASTAGAALDFTEMTAPAAGTTDHARLYAEDNGAGKTRLVVRFPTGAAQVLATEP